MNPIADAQIGRLALSPFQKIEQTIAKTNITVEYSRPSIRGRDIFGSLVPYNEYWILKMVIFTVTGIPSLEVLVIYFKSNYF